MRRLILIVAATGLVLLLPAERANAQADVVINVAETITVSDAVQVLPPAVVSVAETITVSEAVGVVPPAVVDVSETISVSDAVGVVPPAVVEVSETITASDDVQLLPGAVISVGETITISDLFESALSAAPAIGIIAQQAKLGASDGATGDQLGLSVAVNGNTAVLGAPFDDPGTTTDAGAAYVFVRSGTVWSEEATLVASDAADGDNFGISVAIYGDTIVVGSEFDDAPEVQRGSAYVFVRSGTTWTQQAKLLAGDGEGFDHFGKAVAISGDTIVVGARSDDVDGIGSNVGSAYVFVRGGSNWTQQAMLVPGDAAGTDRFGEAVDIDGDSAVIGATVHGHGISQSGSAYVFVRSGTAWTEQAELRASDSGSGHRLGNAASISGDTVVVGAELADNIGGLGAGSAYVFVRTGTTWNEQAQLIASDAGGGDAFGSGVAVNGHTILIGSKKEDGPFNSGALYVFVREGTTWSEQQKVKAGDANASDEFGRAVALSGNTVLVGANLDDDLGSSSGSGYMFHVVNHPPTFDVPLTPLQGTTLTVHAGQSLQFTVQASDVDIQADVTQMTAGTFHTCALLDTGVVRCWGFGGQGRLGYGNTDDIGDNETTASVGDVNEGRTVANIVAGEAYTCAVLDTGAARCWGSGGFSNLGYGNTNDIGDDETPASAGDVNVGSTVAQIAAGTFHTCALLNAGTVRCWGAGGLGRLGSGNNASILNAALAGDVDVGGTVTQITAGKHHTCALLDTGAVRCWGYGLGGRLGYGNTNDIGDNETPATAGDVTVGGTVTQIVAGEEHTCALLDTGAVRCWGLGANGRLGYGNTNNIGDNETPASAADVDVGGTVVQIDAGVFHTCAVLDTGAVRCWGAGGTGRLGYGNSVTIGDDETPATAGDVDVGGTVTQIVTGSHTCALLDTGAVRCWGSGTNGKLGYGNTAVIGDNETPASAGDVDIVDPGDVVTLGAVGLPAGAVFAPGTPANPVSATFTWAPTGADVGSYAVTFTAQDSTSLSATPHVINIAVQQVAAVPGFTLWALAALAGAFVFLLAWRRRRPFWTIRAKAGSL